MVINVCNPPSQDPRNPAFSVILIRSLVPGGAAEQDGSLVPGDRLMGVNGVDLATVSIYFI